MQAVFRNSVVVLFLTICPWAIAQEKELTLHDAVLKVGTDLAPERLKGLQWIEGTRSYSYTKDDRLMQGELGKSADKPIVTLEELNKTLPEEKKLKAFPAIEWLPSMNFSFTHSNEIWQYDVKKKQLSKRAELPEKAKNFDTHEGSGKTAFTQDDDLYITLGDGSDKIIRVTNDGGEGIVNGRSVHREEYGIHKGTFWDPSGEKLAFYRMDESMVTTYALEDISTRPSTFKMIRYPMAGQASHHVTIGIFDVKSGKTLFLNTGGPEDQYLTNIAWDPTGKFIHVVHLDRATEDLKLVRYDAGSGEPMRTLLEEHDDKYLEPQHPIEFVKGRNDQYIWRSPRNGWPHLYLYDVEKGLIRQLTTGSWVVKDVLGMDEKGEYVFVSGGLPITKADASGALETQIYRVAIASGNTERLTKEPGYHRGILSSSGAHLIDIWSSTTVAGRVEIIDPMSGRYMKPLIDPEEPMMNYKMGTIELVQIEGEEGDQLNARLIKPSDLDENQKYPVLIYVYNGPHVQLVANARLGNASPWMIHAAERGYIVWTLDGHGSAYRGRDFEQIIHRRLGEVEVRDQMRGVEYLKTLPYVDHGRIAVHGWSYGGHITTALLTRNPGVFEVGVAGGPVMDWTMYEVMYTERYMDTPSENPEGYTSTALPPLAEKLEDDLLIITGGQDNVVLPQHGLSFIAKCVEKNVPVDFFEYPGHEHNVRGKDRLHLMEKILGYIDQRIEP